MTRMVYRIKNRVRKKLSQQEKVEELYNWYQNIKIFSKIWEIVTSYAFIIAGTGLFLLLSVMAKNLIADIWLKISIDTKFTTLVTFVIFILGIIIGRKTLRLQSKKRSMKKI